MANKLTPNVPEDANDIKEYTFAEDLLGFLCLSTFQEWLQKDYVSSDIEEEVIRDGKKFFKHATPEFDEKEFCEVNPLEEITPDVNPDVAEGVIKPGDHVIWRTLYIWHHAIVESVDGFNLTAVYFPKDENGRLLIARDTIDIREITKENNLYKVTYNDTVEKFNPTELVLARANALVGMDGETLLKNNCENFATFCKSGVSTYQKNDWFMNKMREILRSIWEKANFKFVSTIFKDSAEYMMKLESSEMQKVSRYAQAIGSGVIVAYEGGICMWNLERRYRRYLESSAKNGTKKMSRVEFIRLMLDKISERFFEALFGCKDEENMMATGKLSCPGLGTVVGVVLGIIGGCVGTAISAVIGHPIGKPNIYERTTLRKIKDSKTVRLDELKPGDHIVSYGDLYHPKCHGIVIQVHPKDQHYLVVRHAEERGIVLDDLFYNGFDPLFKVKYPEGVDPYSAEEIVQRAIQEVALERHPWKDCKDFVCSMALKVA